MNVGGKKGKKKLKKRKKDRGKVGRRKTEMTAWPSGLRRVTRNHFSVGGVGSNPAAVDFFTFKKLFLNGF